MPTGSIKQVFQKGNFYTQEIRLSLGCLYHVLRHDTHAVPRGSCVGGALWWQKVQNAPKWQETSSSPRAWDGNVWPPPATWAGRELKGPALLSQVHPCARSTEHGARPTLSAAQEKTRKVKWWEHRGLAEHFVSLCVSFSVGYLLANLLLEPNNPIWASRFCDCTWWVRALVLRVPQPPRVHSRPRRLMGTRSPPLPRDVWMGKELLALRPVQCSQAVRCSWHTHNEGSRAPASHHAQHAATARRGLAGVLLQLQSFAEIGTNSS